jgi:hypothetical protein
MMLRRVVVLYALLQCHDILSVSPFSISPSLAPFLTAVYSSLNYESRSGSTKVSQLEPLAKRAHKVD